jgi:hypothetical protein
VKAGVGQLHSEKKNGTLCWLYDKYGHLARSYRLRNFRLIRIYQDDDRMYNVDYRLEPREELLWEGTRVCGVVTCSFAKPHSPTIIACEMEQKLRFNRFTEPRIS